MVLKVPANAGKVLADGNVVSAQFLFIADAGQHQNLGRLNGSRRQDHFMARLELPRPAVLG